MKNVFFNFPVPVGEGVDHGVGFGGATVVLVSESQGKRLSYRVGTLDGGLVRFGGSVRLVNGMQPAVAVNASGTVVEVHVTSAVGSWRLFYMVGTVNRERRVVDFGSSLPDDAGKVPQVALNGRGVVVMVHETSNLRRNDVHFRVGLVRPDRTVFFTHRGSVGNGRTPTVALNDDNDVVISYRWAEGRESNTLWYNVGKIDADGKASFGDRRRSQERATHPSIALTDDGFALEAHDGGRDQWSRIGRLNAAAQTIDWLSDRIQYRGGGTVPRIAADRETAVQVNRRARRLAFAASRIVDRTSWMADSLALLGDKKLMEIAMPGSHNAGLGRRESCIGGASSCNTQCHNQTVLGQLQVGCRYFELRPTIYQGEMHTGHHSWSGFLNTYIGCNGQPLAEVLEDVRTYLETGRDLVILRFSHYFNRDDRASNPRFSDEQMRTLLRQVTDALHPFLYDGEAPEKGLQSLTVRDLIGGGGKVLAVFAGLEDSVRQGFRGVYSYATRNTESEEGNDADLVVYDRFSNTNDLETMIGDQLGKLKDPRNHGSNLFLLSWTLTQSTGQAVGCTQDGPNSILALARQANEALWRGIVPAVESGTITPARMPNVIFADDIQGMQTDVAIWLNREIHGRR